MKRLNVNTSKRSNGLSPMAHGSWPMAALFQLSAFFVSALSFPAFSFAQCYEVTPIESELGFISAQDLNDHGHVTGQISIPGGCVGDAVIWFGPDEPVWVMPCPPGADGVTADAINNSDGIAGRFSKGGMGGVIHGFTYQNGQFTELPPGHPGERAWSLADGINDHGIVCGWRTHVDGSSPSHAFIWSSKSGFTDLVLPEKPPHHAEMINDNNIVCGAMGSHSVLDWRGFIWYEDKVIDMGPIPNGIGSNPKDLNNNDPPEVVGGGFVEPFPEGIRAFHYRDGVYTVLPILPGFQSASALVINDDGVIVGYSPHPQWRACIWRDFRVADLNDLIHPSATRRPLDVVLDINSSGQILAWAGTSIRSHLLTPVSNLGDINCDGVVNVDDLIKLIGAWGPCREELWCQEDCNSDLNVDVFDLLILLDNWDFSSKLRSKSERR